MTDAITRELSEFSRSRLDQFVTVLVHSLNAPSPDLKAALAYEYDRKGYPTRDDAHPRNTSYGGTGDTIILTLEVKIDDWSPEYEVALRLMETEKENIVKVAREQNEAKRAELQAQIEALDVQKKILEAQL